MRVSVSVVLRDSDEEERKLIGEFTLEPSLEHPSTMAIDQLVEMPNSSSIQVTASYAPSTRQLFVFVREAGSHIFSAVGKIGEGIQYYAFRVTDGTFTELNFGE